MRDAVIVDVVRSPMAKGKAPKDGKPGGALSGVHPVELLGQTVKALLDRNRRRPGRGRRRHRRLRQPGRRAGRAASAAGPGSARACPSTCRRRRRPALRLEPAGRRLRRAGHHGRRLRHRRRRRRRVDEPRADGHRAAWARTSGPSVDRALRPGPGAAGHLRRADRRAVEHRPRDARRVLRALAPARRRGRRERRFDNEIVPITTPDGSACRRATRRSAPSTTVEGLAGLKPAFENDEMARALPARSTGRSPPGNSSQITDGAAALLIMSAERARRARPAAAGPVPRVRRRLRRPDHHADRPDPRDREGVRSARSEHRSDRPLRGQRGLRPGAARLGVALRRRPERSSTRAAARSRWATRSAPPAPG